MSALQKVALDLFGHAVKFPMTLFGDEESRVNERLAELHRQLPSTLPEKRFFRH